MHVLVYFLAMQYPSEISGVTNADFLRSAINSRREEGNEISLMKFIREMDKKMEFLEMDPDMAQRYLNEGFLRWRERNVMKSFN